MNEVKKCYNQYMRRYDIKYIQHLMVRIQKLFSSYHQFTLFTIIHHDTVPGNITAKNLFKNKLLCSNQYPHEW